MEISFEHIEKMIGKIKSEEKVIFEIKNYIKEIEKNRKELEKNYSNILELQKIYILLCENLLKIKKIEEALHQTEKALYYKENEELRIVNYLCLKKLNMKTKSIESLKKGLEKFPDNFLFQKEIKSYQEITKPQKIYENELNNQNSLNRNDFMNNQNNLNNLNINKDSLKMAISMMKNNPQLLESISKSNPNFKNISQDQIDFMLNEKNLDLMNNMIEKNPNLMNNMMARNPDLMPYTNNQDLSNQYNSSHFGNDSKIEDPNILNKTPANNILNPLLTGNLNNIGNTSQSMNPPFGLENKELIKSGLKMFKDNPKFILQTIHSFTQNSHIERLSNVSEKKLKFFGNIFYYLIVIFLEVFSIIRKFKNEIILFLIVYFVYKTMD